MFYTYILRTTGNTLYVGYTKDLHKRLEQHRTHKQGAAYLRSFADCHLVYYETFETQHDAMSREYHLKKLTHDEKEALIKTQENKMVGSF